MSKKQKPTKKAKAVSKKTVKKKAVKKPAAKKQTTAPTSVAALKKKIATLEKELKKYKGKLQIQSESDSIAHNNFNKRLFRLFKKNNGDLFFAAYETDAMVVDLTKPVDDEKIEIAVQHGFYDDTNGITIKKVSGVDSTTFSSVSTGAVRTRKTDGEVKFFPFVKSTGKLETSNQGLLGWRTSPTSITAIGHISRVCWIGEYDNGGVTTVGIGLVAQDDLAK